MIKNKYVPEIVLKTVLITLMIVVFHSCSVMRQANEMKTFANCEFFLQTAENYKLAGVELEGVKKADDLSFSQVSTILLAFAKGNLPLDFTLNILVLNPNSSVAAMNKLEWILFIDDIEMTSGVLNERIEIQPNGSSKVIPVDVYFNLNNALDGKTAEALVNFGMNLTQQGERPTRLMLKAKPYIKVGGRMQDYPGYIKIKSAL